MLNLLGCSKDNFLKIIKQMNYKTIEKNNEVYFRYMPPKEKFKRFVDKNIKSDNPFGVLKNINFK